MGNGGGLFGDPLERRPGAEPGFWWNGCLRLWGDEGEACWDWNNGDVRQRGARGWKSFVLVASRDSRLRKDMHEGRVGGKGGNLRWQGTGLLISCYEFESR